MKKLLLPLLLALLGTGGGVAAAMFLFPAEAHVEAAAATPCGPQTENGAEPPAAATDHEAGVTDADVPPEGRDYARLNNQFVVPVVETSRVTALVLLSISVEVPAGQQDAIFRHEPKLRDVFLQVLFDHANAGGFEGAFTSSANMRTLRGALRAAGRDAVGPEVLDVLITDIVRQDTP